MNSCFPKFSDLYALTWCLFILPLLLLTPLESRLLSIQQRLSASKGRAKETAMPQAAQSAASGVRTSRLLFAKSVGFSALMSAWFSFFPGKWLCLLMSANQQYCCHFHFLLKCEEIAWRIENTAKCHFNPLGQGWDRSLACLCDIELGQYGLSQMYQMGTGPQWANKHIIYKTTSSLNLKTERMELHA